jgi:hypothetical protein
VNLFQNSVEHSDDDRVGVMLVGTLPRNCVAEVIFGGLISRLPCDLSSNTAEVVLEYRSPQ